jgi:hypothetical protein
VRCALPREELSLDAVCACVQRPGANGALIYLASHALTWNSQESLDTEDTENTEIKQVKVKTKEGINFYQNAFFFIFTFAFLCVLCVLCV